MAQQSARRGRENQHFPQCFALGDLDPAHELPYRTVAQYRCITGRTDGSIRLRANTITKFRLDQEGHLQMKAGQVAMRGTQPASSVCYSPGQAFHQTLLGRRV